MEGLEGTPGEDGKGDEGTTAEEAVQAIPEITRDALESAFRRVLRLNLPHIGDKQCVQTAKSLADELYIETARQAKGVAVE